MKIRAVSLLSLSAVVAAGAVSAVVNAAILDNRPAGASTSAVPAIVIDLPANSQSRSPAGQPPPPAAVAAPAAPPVQVVAAVAPPAAPVAAPDDVPVAEVPAAPPPSDSPAMDTDVPDTAAGDQPDGTEQPSPAPAEPVAGDQFPAPTDSSAPAAVGYPMGAAGTAFVIVVGDRLVISQVLPNPGWRLVHITPSGANGQRVTLRNTDGGRVVFTISILHDVVAYSVDTHAAPPGRAPGNPPAAPAPAVGGSGAPGNGHGKGPNR